MFTRVCAARSSVTVSAINEPFMSVDHMAYMLKYDSTHGRATFTVGHEGEFLVVDGKRIRVFHEKNAEAIPWAEAGVSCVVDCTGIYTTCESAGKHISSKGCKKVVISAPSTDAPMFVIGVNLDQYKPSLNVVSNASCTTNCVAPLAKIIDDRFGLVEGLMTTVHAATQTQKVLDGPSARDWRGGRAVLGNIIPASTGAAAAVGKVIPKLAGKLTGISLRVPLADVSVVDLTCRLEKEATLEQIVEAVRSASQGAMKGIVDVTGEQVVSSDFVGSQLSCVLDVEASVMLNSRFVKLIAWYDNEMGYTNRLVDLVAHILKSV